MSSNGSPDLKNIWVATSGNDGAKWSTPVSVLQKPSEATVEENGFYNTQSYYIEGMAAIRTDDNLTLVAVNHHNAIHDPQAASFWSGPDTAGARASLVVINYVTSSTSQPLGADIIYRRQGDRGI